MAVLGARPRAVVFIPKLGDEAWLRLDTLFAMSGVAKWMQLLAKPLIPGLTIRHNGRGPHSVS